MTRKEIYSTLKDFHPNFTNIGMNECGSSWYVDIEDNFEVVTLTYKVEGDKLRFIGRITVEQ